MKRTSPKPGFGWACQFDGKIYDWAMPSRLQLEEELRNLTESSIDSNEKPIRVAIVPLTTWREMNKRKKAKR